MREEERESEAAVVDLVTGWRTDGDDGLEELHVALGLAHDVDRPARVIRVLKQK